jgi:hypothetical protein
VAGTDPRDARHLYETNVVPNILGLRGRSVFHASCVRVGRNGVALLGESGRGKSTLAASFAACGAPFLADDLLLVDPVTPPIAQPSTNTIRLWSASVEALFPKGRGTENYASYSKKLRISSDKTLAYVAKESPLKAAFVIAEPSGSEIKVRLIEGSSSHRVWLENMFILDPQRKDVMAVLFSAAANVASEVATYLISYPRDFRRLPDVRKRILETLEDVTP